MQRSATEIMQDILLAAIVDSIMALKDNAKGIPNNLLRELNAIHPNTAFADLPPALQTAIAKSARSGFNRLLKEGYSVAPATGQSGRTERPHQFRRPQSSGRTRNEGRPNKPAGRRKPPRGPKPPAR